MNLSQVVFLAPQGGEDHRQPLVLRALLSNPTGAPIPQVISAFVESRAMPVSATVQHLLSTYRVMEGTLSRLPLLLLG